MGACDNSGLPHASIWGHAPHYVNTSPNPRLSHALLTKLRSLVEFEVDLEELRLAGETFESEVSKAISGDPDVNSYVRRLEQRYDDAHATSGDLPSSEALVEELEEFLKSQHNAPDGGEGS